MTTTIERAVKRTGMTAEQIARGAHCSRRGRLLPVCEAVARVLLSGPRSAAVLVEAITRHPKRDVYRAVSKLHEEGRVEQAGTRGRFVIWKLTLVGEAWARELRGAP